METAQLREMGSCIRNLEVTTCKIQRRRRIFTTMATDSIKDGEASQCDPETTINDSTSIKIKQHHGSTDNNRGKYQI